MPNGKRQDCPFSLFLFLIQCQKFKPELNIIIKIIIIKLFEHQKKKFKPVNKARKGIQIRKKETV